MNLLELGLQNGACFYFPKLKYMGAHYVEFLMLAGVYPFASSSKFSLLENWKHSPGRWGCFHELTLERELVSLGCGANGPGAGGSASDI